MRWKLLLIGSMIFLSSCAQNNTGFLPSDLENLENTAAAGQGLTSWTAQSAPIASGDLVGITDVSDTTQSDNGSSRKATMTQVGTFMATLFAPINLSAAGVPIVDLGEYLDATNLEDAIPEILSLISQGVDLVIGAGLSITATGTGTETLSVDLSAGTGVIAGKIVTATDADAHVLTEAEYHGGMVAATGAGVYTLPAAAAGFSGCVRAGQGVAAIIQLLPGSGDFIVKNGQRGTAGVSIKSTGVLGDKICYAAVDADDWYIDFFGTWAQ